MISLATGDSVRVSYDSAQGFLQGRSGRILSIDAAAHRVQLTVDGVPYWVDIDDLRYY